MKKRALLILLLIGILVFGTTAFAQEEPDPQEQDLEMLRLYYPDDYDRMITSATRFPKPKGKIAENITVITKEEIKEMNAHTLADVLSNITAVTLIGYTEMGGYADALIQGADWSHTLLLIDGIRMSFLDSNSNELPAFPVHNIDRIEIIKGPASSTWGSSLGGIINVITKDPSVRKISGTISASQGESNTGDFRVEASGRRDKFSYYLYGGTLDSNGVVPGYRLNQNSFYTKLHYDLNEQLTLMFTAGYIKALKGIGEFIIWDETDKKKGETSFATLSMDYSINQDAELKLSLRSSEQNHDYYYITMSTGEIYYHGSTLQKDFGGSALLALRQGIHSIVVGAEFDNNSVTADFWTVPKQIENKHAVFTNDTISFGKLTVTPGIRYDYTTKANYILSPSLGATYRLGDKTLLRLTVAQGFNTPAIGVLLGGDSYGSTG